MESTSLQTRSILFQSNNASIHEQMGDMLKTSIHPTFPFRVGVCEGARACFVEFSSGVASFNIDKAQR